MRTKSTDHLLVLVVSLVLGSGHIAAASPAPRVTLCHFPPGNPAHARILTVGASAVPAHLTQHHDAVCVAGDGDCCFGATGPSVCTDLQDDASNCGTCGNQCPTGTTCTGGSCTNPCAPDTTLCGTVCVNESTDPSNCGACGNQCPTGTTCSSGACTCPAGSTLCGAACVDESSDPNNCGACGNVCDAGSACTAGTCGSACPTGTTSCGGVCVNEGTDDTNCGACGNACPTGTTCAGGSCQSGCPAGSALCAGACVNENTDPNNCGSCGTVCAAGTACTGGTCVATDVAGSCLPTSSLSVLTQGTAPTATVVAYVPLGSWSETATGVIVVQLEPAAGIPTVIATTGAVNSCSSNAVTGRTVCTGNSNDVYVISGTTLLTTLTAAGTGSQNLSGGSCVTCGVATDASTGLAWLAEGTVAATGQLESLNPLTSAFGAPIDLFAEQTSESVSVDPVRHLVLSAVEDGNFQVVDTVSGTVFNSTVNFGLVLDATAEDCSTGIAVAPGEFSSSIVLADLSQAIFTPGAPGTWSAPAVAQDFPDFLSFTSAGVSGIAVAPGSHLAGVTDEFGGPAFGVVQLPSTSGVGVPSAVDFVAASMPNDPSGAAWSMGLDPHTMTAYTSPNSGKALLVMSNVSRTFLALVDMQALLGATRTPGTHTVDPTVDLVAAGIVTFVAE